MAVAIAITFAAPLVTVLKVQRYVADSIKKIFKKYLSACGISLLRTRKIQEFGIHVRDHRRSQGGRPLPPPPQLQCHQR